MRGGLRLSAHFVLHNGGRTAQQTLCLRRFPAQACSLASWISEGGVV